MQMDKGRKEMQKYIRYEFTVIQAAVCHEFIGTWSQKLQHARLGFGGAQKEILN